MSNHSDHTDSDGASDGQECYKNKNYVNIDPGCPWVCFQNNDPLAGFLQGSVCSNCVALSDCAKELSSMNSLRLDSLSLECRLPYLSFFSRLD